MIKLNYDINEYDFQEKFKELFSVNSLTDINEDVAVFQRENDQKTNYHKIYYEWARSDEFKKLYNTFIRDNVLPLYKSSIVYQTIPTFRIAYQNNIAVGEFHKDKNYRDVSWAEKVSEDNFFLPVTDAFDTNTIWVESFEDSGDFFPMNCKYGEFIKWDGSNLTHGNKINKTGRTRISIDFRVILHDKYEESNNKSINTNVEFKIGGYYSLIEV
jgi:hypothetical protein